MNPGPSAFLVAIDKDSAAVKWVAPLHEGHPAAVMTGSPVLDGDRLYVGVSSQEEFSKYVSGYVCCTFRGSVVALDVATGNVIWRTHTISDDAYYSDAGAGVVDAGDGGTWLPAYAGVAVWSSTPVVDRKRKQLYVTTGNNYIEPAAGPSKADGNYVDAVIALDLDTGKVKWANSLPEGGKDIWTLFDTSGPDSDFGAGANLFTAKINGVAKDLVGAGQKSGMYYAFDPDTGATVWKTQVGPGGHLGGIHWGTATDGTRIYVGINNSTGASLTLLGKGPHSGEMTTSGIWSALDTANGEVVWQVADPALDKPLSGASVNGPVAVVNGVLFGGSMDAKGTMFAFNAETGEKLWSFESGGTVYGGPAVANGVVYWGSGYPSSIRPLGFGSTSKQLYAFHLGK
jgi:polyvinyl alcohol dehydrogenase (cytochrome)